MKATLTRNEIEYKAMHNSAGNNGGVIQTVCEIWDRTPGNMEFHYATTHTMDGKKTSKQMIENYLQK